MHYALMRTHAQGGWWTGIHVVHRDLVTVTLLRLPRHDPLQRAAGVNFVAGKVLPPQTPSPPAPEHLPSQVDR